MAPLKTQPPTYWKVEWRGATVHELDRVVPGLDPLGMDGYLTSVTTMNARGDLPELVHLLRQCVLAAPDPTSAPLSTCLAIVRDLGLLAGSVRRHGGEPIDAVASLEPMLATLGERTGMVPRDTVHHYGRWNPRGSRCRSFTGTSEELVLIGSVRTAAPQLDKALELCQELAELHPSSIDLVVGLNELVYLLRSVDDAVDGARAAIPPVVFARLLRPYYDDIRVADARYLGPSGSHLPLALVDLALWGVDLATHDDLRELWRGPARYGPPYLQELGERWLAARSLTSRIREALRTDPEDRGALAAADAVARALRVLLNFRGRHLQLARGAYAAEDETRQYTGGSGGVTLEQLGQLLAATRDAARRSRAVVRDGSVT